MPAQLFIGGQWFSGGPTKPVTNKYTNAIVAHVPEARPQDVDAAIAAAEKAAPIMASLPAHRRSAMLTTAAAKLATQREPLARIIAIEAGKAIKYARAEVDRAVCTVSLAAEEAKRIHGETVPLDAIQSGEGFLGYWTRRPIGVIGAITPFNFPLNLVVHKVAPALAGGNSVVLKPAENTPLSAIELCKILAESGFPDGAINLVCGPGPTVGAQIVSDSRVRKISFTGSHSVGEQITRSAGVKKVTLELGNSSPVILGPDIDIEAAAQRCALGAYYYSGQVCVSAQRIYADTATMTHFTDAFVSAADNMTVGDPLEENVDIGPMIATTEAQRIEQWVHAAATKGAQIQTGGKRENAVYWPTVLSNTDETMQIVAQEAFGPVASLICCSDFEESLRRANATRYGLQAAVFTQDIDRVFHAIRRLDFGGVVINEMPAFRADNMPYGGNRQSGLGREGVRFAIEEMTNIQMVSIRLKN